MRKAKEGEFKFYLAITMERRGKGVEMVGGGSTKLLQWMMSIRWWPTIDVGQICEMKLL